MASIRKHNLLAVSCGLAIIWNCLAAPPVRADQIVIVIDEHGNKVYINTGEPGKATGAWATRSFRVRRGYRPAPPSADINQLVDQTSSRFEIDPQLVHAIIQVESDYNPDAVSRKGAMGLMQLMPATAERFGVGDPFDPKQNMEGGVNYLKYLLELFQGDLALSLAAYNAGEHAVLRQGGVPSFTETRNYVRKVRNLYQPGMVNPSKSPSAQQPFRVPIYRYTDAQNVVHYTNVE